jgi:hypothetical protein
MPVPSARALREFGEIRLPVARLRLKASGRLSIMRKPHVNPPFPALTPEHAATM